LLKNLICSSADRVELLERTSGSTSGEKLIPYTASLRRQFQRAVAVWIADVMRKRPAIRRGRAYWSISPAIGTNRTSPGGIPIGFDSDSAYLSCLERLFLKRLLVVPPGIGKLTSIRNFQYCTLCHLLAAGDLTLVSVWSPTFLTSLLSLLDGWSDQLAGDLRQRRMTLPGGEDPGIENRVLMPVCGKGRVAQVSRILRSNVSMPAKLSQLWPQLELISCWADAAAGTYINGIRQYFPKVTIQPKGLMSTEACVSFPLVGHGGAALSLRSHFFEFIPEHDSPNMESTRLAHQLDVGQVYEVVVTTGGGLYRYQTRDVVEVVGHLNECPLLRFAGRADRISDLVGEKLSESHVSRILHRAFYQHEIKPQFAMLVPIATPAGYCLYLQIENEQQSRVAGAEVLEGIESGLKENPHYGYALSLGQLQPLQMRIVEGTRSRLWPIYERTSLARGQKAGEIKPTALDARIDWHALFESEINSPGNPSVTAVEKEGLGDLACSENVKKDQIPVRFSNASLRSFRNSRQASTAIVVTNKSWL
jgi:hypothetical protein